MIKRNLNMKYKEYLNLSGDKQLLVQQVGDGSIIRRFDKTPPPKKPNDVICPHFLELKWAYGCPYRCAWCYLQGTLRFLPTKTKPVIKDYKKIESHLNSFFEETVNNRYVPELLNSGEIADSLMWENNGSPFSKFIGTLFNSQKKHKVLFLSKSDNIDNLLKLDSDRIVPSFTLNANSIASKWERGAPDIKRRINAAKKLDVHGYQVRIRIDPIVPIENWKNEYVKLINDIFSQFRPKRMTLGSLRGLTSTINNAPDKSWCEYLSEYSSWGKKIDSKIRHEMYQYIINYLKETFGYNDVALCKETIEMWKRLSMEYTAMRCNCIW